jgi:hypothetical protein
MWTPTRRKIGALAVNVVPRGGAYNAPSLDETLLRRFFAPEPLSLN